VIAIAVCTLIIAVVILLWIASRIATYRRVFSDAHFAELRAAAPRLKAAAYERADQEFQLPTGPDDPRALLTSAGLRVFYTVTKEDGLFAHHCSVSLSGGVTPRAVGGRFIAECVRLFGLPADKVKYEVGQSTVHHAEAVLSPAENEALESSARRLAWQRQEVRCSRRS